MSEKRIKIPSESVLFEVSKDGVAILDTTIAVVYKKPG
jgi:hypothetical protein